MLKKLRSLFLLILVVFGLASCGQTQSTNKYSFKDITSFEISNIEKVTYSFSPLQSSRVEFKGNYSKFLDVKYEFMGKDENIINNYEDARENFNFVFEVDLIDSNEVMLFYVYKNKIYFANDNVGLYKSVNSVSLLSLRIEAEV